jgi:hypothetical protein
MVGRELALQYPPGYLELNDGDAHQDRARSELESARQLGSLSITAAMASRAARHVRSAGSSCPTR